MTPVGEAEVEIWPAALAQVCKPGAKADNKPFRQIEWRKQHLPDLPDRLLDGVENADSGWTLIIHNFSPLILQPVVSAFLCYAAC